MPHTAISPIPDIVRGLDAIAVALLSRKGGLWDANRGFLALLRETELPGELADVRHVFAQPSFEALAAGSADPVEGVIFRGVISLRDTAGKVTPLRGCVFAHDADLLLVAEHDIGEVTTLRNKLLAAADDLSARDHEIDRLQQDLEEARGLATAALRDRDALLDALSRDASPPSPDSSRR
jgi:hypothetical protein